jgi:methionyl-tRNA synthetase
MLRAEKEGITPEALIDRVTWRTRTRLRRLPRRLRQLHIRPHSDETALLRGHLRQAEGAGLIEVRAVEQFYDPVKEMFLPDRFIKGECPKCGAKDQYGDSCEVLRRGLRPHRPEESALRRLRRDAGAQVLRPLLLQAVRSALPGIPAQGDARSSAKLQPEAANKMQEWLGEPGENKLTDWDISRDAPYFGFEIPDAPGKYFYVWLDAPIGYFGSLKQPRRAPAAGDRRGSLHPPRRRHRDVPLHRQGHPLLPRPVLAGRCWRMPATAPDGGVRPRLPDGGRPEDVKSRGTFITAESYLKQG